MGQLLINTLFLLVVREGAKLSCAEIRVFYQNIYEGVFVDFYIYRKSMIYVNQSYACGFFFVSYVDMT